MYQGETLTVVISGFPVKVETISHIRIAYMMQKTVLLSLDETDCIIDSDKQTVTFTLTQEQSLSLSSGTVSRHVVILTESGARYESKIEDELIKYTAVTEVI